MLAELRARITRIQGRSSDLSASTSLAEELAPDTDTATDIPRVDSLPHRSGVASGGTASAREGAPPIATHPGLAHLLRIQPGASYSVDSASLAVALLAGASAGGRWVAAVGWDDLGVEAAAQYGADLSRMVVVPDPGPDWVEVTAALVDVVGLVAVRPTGSIEPSRASVLSARLRTREAALVVWGDWPGCTARLRLERVSWSGPAHGTGRLTGRSAQVAVLRGSAPPVRGRWDLDGAGGQHDGEDSQHGGQLPFTTTGRDHWSRSA